jgi:Predicted membrane protein
MKRDTRIVAATLVAIAGVILSASIACTAAIAHGASMRWRLLFRIFCHGIPERCLVLWNIPMPICARCTAIYAGLALSLAAFLLLPRMKEPVARMALFAAVFPMALDGLTQLVNLRVSTNSLRIETGLLAGIAFGVWALSAVENHVAVTIP